MLGPVRETPYDMRFALFGVPVVVTPMFWLAAAIFGWGWLSSEGGHPLLLLTWMLCVFVSILIHEFGHALTMKFYGDRPRVLLYHFGGLAFPTRRETPGRAFLVTAAGPAIQLALFALLTLVCLAVARVNLAEALTAPAFWRAPIRATVLLLIDSGRLEPATPAYAAVVSMLDINLSWALLNLIPVLPLDGGRLVESGLAVFGVRSATLWSLRVSLVAAVTAAVVSFGVWHSFYLGIMFALLGVESYRALQGPRGPY